MRLAQLLEDVSVTKLLSLSFGKMLLTQDVEVHALQYDSRKVGQGDLFVAIRGTADDGHRFIDQAVSRGATVAVMEDDGAMPDSYFVHRSVIKIVVPDSRKALATMAGNFHHHPSRRLTLVGVTGTNGKTTTTHVIRSILQAQGGKVGLIGTIEYSLGEETVPATHTTPESLELNSLLATMVEGGCTAAVMEVSSHSLALSRVHGLTFAAATFTNLTQDHLDFHGTMAGYLQAKKILFDSLPAGSGAVTNADDPYGMRMVEGSRASVLTFGIHATADVTATDVDITLAGTRLTVVRGAERLPVASRLTGRFNASNILAACATGLALGVGGKEIAEGVAKLTAVRGRFEQVPSPGGWTAIIDYAHTPDALENCLRTIHELLPPGRRGRVITVFGCGGNRDRGKRPIMGGIATRLSDLTIVTSDNPRKEDPGSIIREILQGVTPGRTVYTEPDRRAAIRRALGLAQTGDVVLVAGKGHEDYQVVGDRKIHFDDREEVELFMRGAS